MKGNALFIGDTLHLSFEVKPMVYKKKDGSTYEILEIADCDCFFRFSYDIQNVKMIESNSILANGKSIEAISKIKSSIEEELDIEIMDVAFADEANNSVEILDFYDIVDEQPQFSGGMPGFYKYVNKELKYPSKALLEKIEGRVFIEIIINELGEIDDNKVRTLKGHKYLNEEAERIFKNCPNWTPGKVDNKNVPVRLILPITFNLPK